MHWLLRHSLPSNRQSTIVSLIVERKEPSTHITICITCWFHFTDSVIICNNNEKIAIEQMMSPNSTFIVQFSFSFGNCFIPMNLRNKLFKWSNWLGHKNSDYLVSITFFSPSFLQIISKLLMFALDSSIATSFPTLWIRASFN